MGVIEKKLLEVSFCLLMLSLGIAYAQGQEEKVREVEISNSIHKTVISKLKKCKCDGFKVKVGNRLAFVFLNPDIAIYHLDTGTVFTEKEIMEALNNIVKGDYTPTTKKEIEEIILSLQKPKKEPINTIYTEYANVCRITERTKEKLQTNLQSPYGKIISFEPAELSRSSTDERKNSIEDNELSIYFPTAQSTLGVNDISDILKYTTELSARDSFVIEGYCDPRGATELNGILSQQRIDSVSAYLRGQGFKNITAVSYGESKANETSKENYQNDRRVTIIPERSALARGLRFLEKNTDIFLIDSSGSMMEAEKWQEVERYRFPQHAEVYYFRQSIKQFNVRIYPARCRCQSSLSMVTPDGSTPLYAALESLMLQIENGTRISVLTDGEDTMSKSAAHAVVTLAQQKGISISILGIKLQKKVEDEMKELAQITGGMFYLIKE